MSGHAFRWRRFGLLAGTGGGVLVLTSILTAAFAFGDADDPLSGSDTAIILGGTFESTPSTSFAQTAEDLYLHPLGFDDGATSSTVCDMVGTDPCAAPLQVLTTPELIQQGTSSLTGADDLTLAVENEFNADPGAFSAEHPLTIFGYSQGATVESIAMTQLAEAGIPSADLHFVSIGDLSLPVDGVNSNLVPDLDSLLGSSLTNTLVNFFGLNGILGNVTPDDLYPATIYTAERRRVRRLPAGLHSRRSAGCNRGHFRPRGLLRVDTNPNR
jgi:PE-PPE domain